MFALFQTVASCIHALIHHCLRDDIAICLVHTGIFQPEDVQAVHVSEEKTGSNNIERILL